MCFQKVESFQRWMKIKFYPNIKFSFLFQVMPSNLVSEHIYKESGVITTKTMMLMIT